MLSDLMPVDSLSMAVLYVVAAVAVIAAKSHPSAAIYIPSSCALHLMPLAPRPMGDDERAGAATR